jgi:hypothetical protein
MIRLAAAMAVLFSLGAVQAGAAEPPKPAPADTQYVDLAPVALPIVVEGRLINYVFVTVRLQLTASADAAKVRAKEPFFRDALVRAAHREPFTDPSDYTAIDAVRLRAVLLREATAIAGKSVKAAVIVSQTPKRRRGLPKPAIPAAPQIRS